MKTYYRILVNKQTKEIEHCMTSDAPLFDNKIIETLGPDLVTGVPTVETEYDEWNGVMEDARYIRPGVLLKELLEPTVADLDQPPTMKLLSDKDKVITIQKNIEKRYVENAGVTFKLDKTKILDKTKASEITVEELETDLGRKKLAGEDVTKLKKAIDDEKIKEIK